MTPCPVCGWENPNPAEPGDVLCVNPACGATFAWPVPAPPDPEPTPGDILDGLTDEQILLLANELANRMAPIEAAPTPPVTASLVGNGLQHSTSSSATKVTVQVIAPAGGPIRARPTIDGTPVGAGVYTYDQPSASLLVRTNAGNNDVVIIEEFV